MQAPLARLANRPTRCGTNWSKNEIVAEYALRDLAKPVGVASYVTKLVESLPTEFRESLPSPEQWQAELEGKDSSKGKL